MSTFPLLYNSEHDQLFSAVYSESAFFTPSRWTPAPFQGREVDQPKSDHINKETDSRLDFRPLEPRLLTSNLMLGKEKKSLLMTRYSR